MVYLFKHKLSKQDRAEIVNAKNLNDIITGLQFPMGDFRKTVKPSDKHANMVLVAYDIFNNLAFYNEDPHTKFLAKARKLLPKLAELLE